jgi:hypothetical protein
LREEGISEAGNEELDYGHKSILIPNVNVVTTSVVRLKSD